MEENRYQGKKHLSIWHDTMVHAANLTHTVFMTVPFALCWFLYYADRILDPFSWRGDWLVTGLFALLCFVFCDLYEGFQIPYTRRAELIYSQSLGAVMADGCLYIVTVLLARQFLSPLPLMAALIAQVLCAAMWTLLVHRIYFHLMPPLKTVLVGDEVDRLRELIQSDGLERRFVVTDSVSITDFLEQPERYASNADVFFLWDIQSHERNQILKLGAAHGIPVYFIPRIGDVLMSGAKPIHLFHLPVLLAEGYHPTPEYLLIKRLFDILIAAIAMLVLSPVLLVTAHYIRKDGGPAVYHQKRLTQNGRIFEILKLRSMRTDAEKDGVARLSTGENDDRITPIGRKIRAVRLDETVQGINVLLNHMSIVGPRPERPEIAEEYEKELPEFALRTQAKAGISGYAQVYGKYNSTPYEKLLMDLQYIMRPSLLIDLKILFATVKVLFMKESTEGVEQEDGKTADLGDTSYAQGK